MPNLRHLSTSPWKFYQGTDPDTARPWPVGEVREVGQDVASYLLEEYPEAFAKAGEVKAVAPAEPEVDRAMKSPTKRKATKASKAKKAAK